MSTDLTTGRSRKCKALGGLSEIYIFPYVQYSNSQIVTSGLTLTSFPATTIYRFFIESTDFSNPGQEDAGGKFYKENISLTFPIISILNEFEKLLKKDHRMIVRDRNGLYRLLGAYIGGVFNNLRQTTGGSHSELTGYTIDYEATEEQPALFIGNTLADLTSAGFTVSADNFLITESGELVLTEDNQEIIIE